MTVESVKPNPIPIEQMISELTAAGWKKYTSHIWSSPEGKLFLGPYGAWKRLTGKDDGGRYAEVTVSTVTQRP